MAAVCEGDAVLDHVTLTIADLDRGLAFYDAALAPLGGVRVSELVDEEEDEPVVEAVGYGLPDEPAQLWVVRGTPVTSGLHIRLSAPDRAAVQAFHDAAVAAGGTVFAAPRRRVARRAREVPAPAEGPARAGPILPALPRPDRRFPARWRSRPRSRSVCSTSSACGAPSG